MNPCCEIVCAGSGLGKSITYRFAQGGFDIALISRNQDQLHNLTGALNSDGYTSNGFAADAAKNKQLEYAFDQVDQWNDHIQVMIYNAATMISDNVTDLTPSVMMDKMVVNLGGAIFSVNILKIERIFLPRHCENSTVIKKQDCRT